ncbi:hypothetical protein F5B22DRAFT_624717 [Xylaria bambusicola]|uniref:uncharacterized protein n=1 Tax=Xylaria bambusicola TaxID=326684 RepID=UPI002008821B|nr:uncharacterized protein F5B22DRAFT_624717 [Xylaria bambusicola]KAI0506232.1 hypothetical protein F5B22DRAFT_624717 [Xylaria bambusicola]
MDAFRSTHVERSNSQPPRSDISRADLVVERPLIRPTDSPSRSHVYYDQQLPPYKNSLPAQAPYSQGVTSHPIELGLNSSLLGNSRGEFGIGSSDDQAQSQGIASLREEENRELSKSFPSSVGGSTMSAVAVSFDPRMEMGVPRSTYTWHSLPGLESSPELLSHDISSVGHGSDISSLTPPPSGSRSLTSSPPRPIILTPEQRELKRQRDQARRDSKTSVRVRRGMSNNSYTPAGQSPPVSMHEFSSASPVPIYTTAPTQISLLAEPVTTVGPSYLPSYSTSPLPDHGNSQMFSPHYSPLPSNDYMGMNYQAGYPPPPSHHSLSSQYSSRASSESGMMYSVQPAVLPPGNPSGADTGHVRVVQSRPKPQCWEHGCNGRQFSTFSNLLRHQREKSGQAAKASCPNCGAEFTRTTARNGHLLHDKCKQRRNS